MSDANASRAEGRARWDVFLRAFAKEVDDTLQAPVRDAWLRRAGAQMAQDLTLAPSRTLEELENNVNEALGELGWGRARLEFDAPSRLLSIFHVRLPAFETSAGNSSWFPAVLEGLYTAWLGQQPDADRTHFAARRTAAAPADGSVALVYGRRERIETTDSARASPAGPQPRSRSG